MKQSDPLDNSAQSFADLVMNLLAILIVITLITILFVKSTAILNSYAVDIPAERDRILALSRLSGIPKFATHFYVTKDGFFEIDTSALANAVISQHDAQQGEAFMLGKAWGPVHYDIMPNLTIETDPVIRGYSQDPGQYDIRLTFPTSPITPIVSSRNNKTNSIPMDTLTAHALIESRAYTLNRAPNFIVAPDGFDVFAALEKILFAENKCFRWSYTKYSMIAFKRTPYFSRKFAARRCTR